jgi:hypothetical protein
MTQAPKLERAFSMNEAAQILRVSRRKLQDLIKDHPYYYLNGNRKLFTESDILGLREVMRDQIELDRQRKKECRSSLSIRAPESRRITRSGERISGSMWIEAQKRLSALRLQNF